MNFIGLPPHTCIDGTTLPGGTTLFGAIIAPCYTIAPYNITEFCPIYAFYFKMHEYKVHPCWITTSSSIISEDDNPEDTDAAVCSTQLFPMHTLLWILFVLINKLHNGIDITSNNGTVPYTYTTTEKYFTSDCSVRCNEYITSNDRC